jgi:hypothetical protein
METETKKIEPTTKENQERVVLETGLSPQVVELYNMHILDGENGSRHLSIKTESKDVVFITSCYWIALDERTEIKDHKIYVQFRRFDEKGKMTSSIDLSTGYVRASINIW